MMSITNDEDFFGDAPRAQHQSQPQSHPHPPPATSQPPVDLLFLDNNTGSPYPAAAPIAPTSVSNVMVGASSNAGASHPESSMSHPSPYPSYQSPYVPPPASIYPPPPAITFSPSFPHYAAPQQQHSASSIAHHTPSSPALGQAASHTQPPQPQHTEQLAQAARVQQQQPPSSPHIAAPSHQANPFVSYSPSLSPSPSSGASQNAYASHTSTTPTPTPTLPQSLYTAPVTAHPPSNALPSSSPAPNNPPPNTNSTSSYSLTAAYTPSSSSSSQQSSQPANAAITQMMEKMQMTVESVIKRMDGVESRLSSLELVTKEILNTQRGIQTQQKKMQDVIDSRDKVPEVLEAPRRVQAPTPTPVPAAAPVSVYPTHAPVSTIPSYYPPPPVTISSTPTPPPSFVPVTRASMADNSYNSDAELAKRLQAEFDQEQGSQSKPQPKATPQPKPQPQQSQSECPICAQRISAADLEAHVEQHFEDDEGRKTGTAAKANNDKKEKGFFGKLFSKDEEKKETPLTSSKTSESSSKEPSVPYTNTVSSSNSSSTSNSNSSSDKSSSGNSSTNNQNVMAYPRMMMAPGGYYPGMQYAPGRMPGYYPAYPAQRMPGNNNSNNVSPQQYLYYPSLDQNNNN